MEREDDDRGHSVHGLKALHPQRLSLQHPVLPAVCLASPTALHSFCRVTKSLSAQGVVAQPSFSGLGDCRAVWGHPLSFSHEPLSNTAASEAEWGPGSLFPSLPVTKSVPSPGATADMLQPKSTQAGGAEEPGGAGASQHCDALG